MSDGAWLEAIEEHEDDLGDLDDVEGPSKIPLDNLAVQVLGSMLVGNRQLVLLGELVAEYHRYQMRAEAKCRREHDAAGPKPAPRSPRESVSEFFGVERHVLAAARTWRAYLSASEAGGRKVWAARDELAAFDEALADAVAFLREANRAAAPPTDPSSA